MSKVILPTVGRVVWYRPAAGRRQEGSLIVFEGGQPCAAQVSFVWNERCVNLRVIDHAGIEHPRSSIRLLQEGDTIPGDGAPYCEWMPYQLGQAARTEQAEAGAAEKLLKRSTDR